MPTPTNPGSFEYFRAGAPLPVLGDADSGTFDYERADVPLPAFIVTQLTNYITVSFGPPRIDIVGETSYTAGAIAVGFGPPTIGMAGTVGTVTSVTGTIGVSFGPTQYLKTSLAGYVGSNAGVIAVGFGPPTIAMEGFTFPPVYGPIGVAFGPPSIAMAASVSPIWSGLSDVSPFGGFIVVVNGVVSKSAIVQTVSWSVPGTREFGKASLWIARSDPAFDAMADNRHFRVTLHGPVVGSLRGLCVGYSVDGAGASLEILSYEALLDREEFKVGWMKDANLEGMTSGVYIRKAFMDGVAGKVEAPISLGLICESGPTVNGYQIIGQPFIQIVMDLTEITGMEHTIDHMRRFHWGPPRGTLYNKQLADGGGIRVNLPNKISFLNQTTVLTTRTASGHEKMARA